MATMYDRYVDVMIDMARPILSSYGLDGDVEFCARIDHACRIAASDIVDIPGCNRASAIEMYRTKLDAICKSYRGY